MKKTLLKTAFALTLLFATTLGCTLVNISVEPAVTQFYTAGFQIQFSNVTSVDWKKDIDIFILRSEDGIPIEDVYQYPEQKIKFSIPDNGNTTTGFFPIGPKYTLDKEYVFWVQSCNSQLSQSFVVVNQYGIGDQVGNFVIWIKNNIFVLLIVLVIVALLTLFLRPILAR